MASRILELPPDLEASFEALKTMQQSVPVKALGALEIALLRTKLGEAYSHQSVVKLFENPVSALERTSYISKAALIRAAIEVGLKQLQQDMEALR